MSSIIINNLSTNGASAANDIGAASGSDTGEKIRTLANVANGADVTADNAPKAHAASHKHGGSDEIATATPGANVIPKAGADSKLAAGFIPQATNSAVGGALLGASGGAAKLTAMPDGATAVYAYNSAWNTYGFATYQGTISYPSADIIRCTYASGSLFNLASPLMSNIDYKTVVLRARANRAAPVNYLKDGSTIVKPLSLTTEWQIFVIILPASCNVAKFSYTNATSGDWLEINWLWIGDYSYLPGSLSEEAARIANELGDTAGVAVAASGNIDFSVTNPVQVGDTVTVHGKTYQYVAALSASPGVEGEILWDSDVYQNHERLRKAIATGNNGTTSWSTQHPTVTMIRPGGNLIGIVSARTPGINGNQIVLSALVAAVSGGRITLSNANGITGNPINLSGGKDAVGDKIHTQLQTMPATTSKYGAALLAADGGTTAGTVVQANDARLATAPAAWTPVPKFGGVADDGTYTVSQNRFTKAGKKYTYDARIVWTAKGTKTGEFSISGIVQAAATSGIPAGWITCDAGMSGLTAGAAIVSVVTTLNITFRKHISGGLDIALTDANFTSTSDIRIHIEFIAS